MTGERPTTPSRPISSSSQGTPGSIRASKRIQQQSRKTYEDLDWTKDETQAYVASESELDQSSSSSSESEFEQEIKKDASKGESLIRGLQQVKFQQVKFQQPEAQQVEFKPASASRPTVVEHSVKDVLKLVDSWTFEDSGSRRWNSSTSSMYIDSLMDGFSPIRPIIINSDPLQGKRSLIDGKARIKAIRLFVQGSIPCHDFLGRCWYYKANPKATELQPSQTFVFSASSRKAFDETRLQCMVYSHLSEKHQKALFYRLHPGTMEPGARLEVAKRHSPSKAHNSSDSASLTAKEHVGGKTIGSSVDASSSSKRRHESDAEPDVSKKRKPSLTVTLKYVKDLDAMMKKTLVSPSSASPSSATPRPSRRTSRSGTPDSIIPDSSSDDEPLFSRNKSSTRHQEGLEPAGPAPSLDSVIIRSPPKPRLVRTSFKSGPPQASNPPRSSSWTEQMFSELGMQVPDNAQRVEQNQEEKIRAVVAAPEKSKHDEHRHVPAEHMPSQYAAKVAIPRASTKIPPPPATARAPPTFNKFVIYGPANPAPKLKQTPPKAPAPTQAPDLPPDPQPLAAPQVLAAPSPAAAPLAPTSSPILPPPPRHSAPLPASMSPSPALSTASLDSSATDASRAATAPASASRGYTPLDLCAMKTSGGTMDNLKRALAKRRERQESERREASVKRE